MNIFLAEFLGTLLLVLLGNGAIATVLLSRSKGEGSGWFVVTAGWGFALTLAIYAVGWVSGAHLNPAITIAMATMGRVATDLVPQYLFGQFLGAMAGAALMWLVYLPHWSVTENKANKLMCFCTKPAVKKPFVNMLVEVIATAVFLFGILTVLDERTGFTTASAPLMIGFLIFGIGLTLGSPTGFALNPARDLGPRVMHALLPVHGKGESEWDYAWVPVVGPIVGAIVGSLFYQAFTAAMTVAPQA